LLSTVPEGTLKVQSAARTTVNVIVAVQLVTDKEFEVICFGTQTSAVNVGKEKVSPQSEIS
jgi:hypothetical protein